MNMAADSHQLLQFAIENDDTDLIHVILINERILHQQAKVCAVSRQLSTPKTHTLNVRYMRNTRHQTNLHIREYRIKSTALRHAIVSSVGISMRNKVFCYRFLCILVSPLVSV